MAQLPRRPSIEDEENPYYADDGDEEVPEDEEDDDADEDFDDDFDDEEEDLEDEDLEDEDRNPLNTRGGGTSLWHC